MHGKGIRSAGGIPECSGIDCGEAGRHGERFYGLGILLLGAGLFFAEGALSALGRAGLALIPFIPWIAGSLAALLAVCFLGHAWFVYRQRRMEQEYAYRREVLERTGMVLMDKSCVALPPSGTDGGQTAPGLPPAPAGALPEVAADVVEVEVSNESVPHQDEIDGTR